MQLKRDCDAEVRKSLLKTQMAKEEKGGTWNYSVAETVSRETAVKWYLYNSADAGDLHGRWNQNYAVAMKKNEECEKTMDLKAEKQMLYRLAKQDRTNK